MFGRLKKLRCWHNRTSIDRNMAIDFYEAEYHLTPTGWMVGTTSEGSTMAPPSDRVETWLYRMEQRSGWSPEDRDWRLIWMHPTMPISDRVALRSSFQSPGREFPSN
jgi:hypothetical protein